MRPEEAVRNQTAALYADNDEHALVGAVNLDPDAIFTVNVPSTAFHDPLLRKIWSAMLKLSEAGVDTNIITISDALPDVQFPDLSVKISRCIESAPSAAAINWYAERVKSAAARRRNLLLAEELAKDAHRPEVSPEQSAARIVTRLIDDSHSSDSDAESSAVVMNQVSADVAEWCSHPLRPGETRGLPTGLRALDAICEGIQPGLYIVAAETHTGKTGLALHISQHVAAKKAVLYLTFEQGRREMALRQVCSMAGVSSKKAKRGALSHDERYGVEVAAAQLSEPEWYWYDGDNSLHSVLSQVYKLHARHDLGLVVVDNLGYVTTGQEREYDNLTQACRALLSVSRRLDVAVMALHQVNRSPSGYNRPRPRMKDLRDAGTIEETASVVWILEKSATDGGEALGIARNMGETTGEIITIHQDKNKLDGIMSSARIFRLPRTDRLYDIAN